MGGLIPEGLVLAKVQTINYQALRDGSEEEQKRLLDACCKDGFIYLDMNGTAPDINAAIEDMYELDKEIYALPQEEKLKFDVDKLSPLKLNGYKPVGRNHGGLAGGKDGFETWALPKDGIRKFGPRAEFEHPSVVDAHWSSLETFTRAVSNAEHTLLSSLSKSLNLPPNETFHSTHRQDVPSLDVIRLLKYHAQPLDERGFLHTPHTDLGSLTFLFTKQWGLEILAADSGDWEWVQPKDGHAIVNIADCLSFLTAKKLKSSLHRVGPLPGQPMEERYSFACLVRPDENAVLKAVSSPQIPVTEMPREVFTSAEWLQRKFGTLRKEGWTKEKDWILTGA